MDLLPNDIENIESNLIKNAYPPFLINKVIKKYLDYKFFSNQDQLKDKSDIYHFKLPYIGNLSHYIKNKILKLCKEFYNENFNTELVFNLFKIRNDLKSLLVYTFTCASCSSSYIGETCCHFQSRLRSMSKRMTSLIFLNIYTPPQHASTHMIPFVLK